MKIRVVLLAFIVLAIPTGCGWFQAGDAQILSFSFQGIEISVSIDPATNSVTVSAPAVDLSTVTPDVTVSEGATLTNPAPFEDGVPQTLVITAENGDTVEWDVTINLRLGISFQVDGDLVFLESGLTDSFDPVLASDIGDGVPLGSLYGTEGAYTGFDIFASSDTIDLSDPDPAAVYLALYLSLPANPSEWLGTTYTRGIGDDTFSVEAYSEEPTMSLSEGQATLATVSDPEGGFWTGTFWFSGDGVAVTVGFFKVQQVMNDAYNQYDVLFGGGE
ncbi:MAG: hypothetical protein E4H09_01800 [Spirochaetales bacterium]|nr:MAG: hypothetical protein E4H09_01800 [Spirochaetales bacterium]